MGKVGGTLQQVRSIAHEGALFQWLSPCRLTESLKKWCNLAILAALLKLGRRFLEHFTKWALFATWYCGKCLLIVTWCSICKDVGLLFFQLRIQSMIVGMVYHWWKNSSLVGSREGTAASNSSKPSSSPPGSISVQKSTFAHELGAGKCRTCAATASWPPLSRWPTTCPWSRGPLNLKKTVSASASPFFFLERGSP